MDAVSWMRATAAADSAEMRSLPPILARQVVDLIQAEVGVEAWNLIRSRPSWGGDVWAEVGGVVHDTVSIMSGAIPARAMQRALGPRSPCGGEAPGHARQCCIDVWHAVPSTDLDTWAPSAAEAEAVSSNNGISATASAVSTSASHALYYAWHLMQMSIVEGVRVRHFPFFLDLGTSQQHDLFCAERFARRVMATFDTDALKVAIDVASGGVWATRGALWCQLHRTLRVPRGFANLTRHVAVVAPAASLSGMCLPPITMAYSTWNPRIARRQVRQVMSRRWLPDEVVDTIATLVYSERTVAVPLGRYISIALWLQVGFGQVRNPMLGWWMDLQLPHPWHDAGPSHQLIEAMVASANHLVASSPESKYKAPQPVLTYVSALKNSVRVHDTHCAVMLQLGATPRSKDALQCCVPWADDMAHLFKHHEGVTTGRGHPSDVSDILAPSRFITPSIVRSIQKCKQRGYKLAETADVKFIML